MTLLQYDAIIDFFSDCDAVHTVVMGEMGDTTFTSHLPECWTSAQANYFKKERSWLLLKSGKLGCSTCRDVKTLGAYSTCGMKLNQGWCDCQIGCYGSTKKTQQISLRKKIFDHAESEAHKRAAVILQNSKLSSIPSIIASQHHHRNETTTKVFRTVYNIVKKNRPFADLPSEVDLQEMNGVSMGQILHSNVSATNITIHIAREMKERVARKLIDESRKFSLLIDESTTLSGKTALIIYLRLAL